MTAVDNSKFNPNKKKLSIRNELTFGNQSALLCVYVGRISLGIDFKFLLTTPTQKLIAY